MKKRILLLFVMLLTITITSAQLATGVQFDQGDVKYEVNADNTTVKVVGFSDSAAASNVALVIPANVDDNEAVSSSYTVTTIADKAFQTNTAIISLVIEGNTHIGKLAFNNSDSLLSATFDLVTSSGTFAISACDLLTEVHSDSYALGGGDTGMFQNNVSLTTVDLPALESGAKIMFLNCPLLTTVNLPALTTIGGIQMFKDCTGLTDVNLDALTTIAANTFENCSALTNVSLNSLTDLGTNVFTNLTALETVSLPALTTAGASLFEGCTALTTTTFTNLATATGDAMFRSCTALGSIDLPALTDGGVSMFAQCTALTTISAPLLLVADNYMFNNCDLLSDVTLTSLQSTGTQAFLDCESLASLELPALTQTGNLCFQNCTALKNLNAPVLATVNTGSFNATGLESIVFPAGVTFNAAGADNHFGNATLLKHIGFVGTSPDISGFDLASMFVNVTDLTIVVPEGEAAAAAAAGWSGFSIVEGTLSKTATDITYSRNLSVDDDWFLVSSPVNDEKYNNQYVIDNGIDADGTGSNNAIAFYVSGNAIGSKWSYMEDGQDLDFTPGVGYSVKRTATTGAGNISFTGTSLNTGAITGVPVSTAGDANNLLGNPYLANLDSNVFLMANANLSGEIWLYNQATNDYDNHPAIDGHIIAAGQGFFVNSVSATTVDFSYPATGTATGTFQKTVLSKIKLLINSGDTERYAKIYFAESATAGYDKGMDGETFTGVSNKMDVFTHLLENNSGKNYQVQSLPMANIEATVVPVGLIAEAGKQITFSAETLNIPDNLKVFLEDRQTNTFTRLDEENSKYEVTLSDELEGTGRFFIHTSTNSVLSIDSTILEGVSVYKSNASTLRIVGLSQGKATVKLFNVLGKQMMKTSFETSGSDEVSLSNLATGVYIVQLETENGKLNKKIILE